MFVVLECKWSKINDSNMKTQSSTFFISHQITKIYVLIVTTQTGLNATGASLYTTLLNVSTSGKLMTVFYQAWLRSMHDVYYPNTGNNDCPLPPIHNGYDVSNKKTPKFSISKQSKGCPHLPQLTKVSSCCCPSRFSSTICTGQDIMSHVDMLASGVILVPIV